MTTPDPVKLNADDLTLKLYGDEPLTPVERRALARLLDNTDTCVAVVTDDHISKSVCWDSVARVYNRFFTNPTTWTDTASGGKA